MSIGGMDVPCLEVICLGYQFWGWGVGRGGRLLSALPAWSTWLAAVCLTRRTFLGLIIQQGSEVRKDSACTVPPFSGQKAVPRIFQCYKLSAECVALFVGLDIQMYLHAVNMNHIYRVTFEQG